MTQLLQTIQNFATDPGAFGYLALALGALFLILGIRAAGATMTQFSLSFLAGAMTVAIGVFANGGRPAFVTYILGLMTAAAIAAALLGSISKLKRAARFLAAFAAGLEQRRPAPSELASGDGVSTIEQEIASALVNFGTRKKAAAIAARAAVEQVGPSASFQDTFQAAVAIARTPKAA